MKEILELFRHWRSLLRLPYRDQSEFWAILADLRDGNEGTVWQREFMGLRLDEGQPRSKSYCLGCKYRLSYLGSSSCKLDTSIYAWDVAFCEEKR